MANRSQLLSVSVVLKGTELRPEEVTAKLGIHPTRTQQKGLPKGKRSKAIAKFGLWALNHVSRSGKLEDLIDELLDTIGTSPIRLDELPGVEFATLDVFYACDEENTGSPGGEHVFESEHNFSQSQLGKLSQLGLSLQLTVSHSLAK